MVTYFQSYFITLAAIRKPIFQYTVYYVLFTNSVVVPGVTAGIVGGGQRKGNAMVGSEREMQCIGFTDTE